MKQKKQLLNIFQNIQKTSFILIVSYTSLTVKSNKIIQKRSKTN